MGAIEGTSYYFLQLVSGIKVKAIFASIVVSLELMMGGWNGAVEALWMLMVMDLMFGFWEAWKNNSVSFRRLRQGVWKAVLYCSAILLGHQVDLLILHNEVEFGFRNAFIVYLGVNEALSIIRHMGNFGLPVPKKITDKLEGIRNSFD